MHLAMFKILVDGRTHGSYTNATVCVTVGSAADADVRLASAAAEHITIYPLKDGLRGCFKVTVHARDGMTHHTKHWTGRRQTVQWTTDPPYWLVGTDIGQGNDPFFLKGPGPPGWVLLHGGDSMTVKGHEIKVINWCGTCGRHDKDLWQCTCAERAT